MNTESFLMTSFYLIPFNDVLQYSAYKTCISFAKYIPNYFILFNAVIIEIVFLNLVFDLFASV